MRVSDSIRYLARDIIREYVKFVQRKVNENDVTFIKSGIDKDFDTYEELFEVVLAYVFNGNDNYCSFDAAMVHEIAGNIDIAIANSKYNRIMKKYSEGVYDTCIRVYKKVAKEVV